MPADAPVRYFMARLPGGDVGAIGGQMPEGAPQPATWNTYVWVDDADATAAKVARRRRHRGRGADGRLRAGPHGRVRRPGGRRVLASGSPSPPRRAVVNEHGSLNFNSLNSRDLDGGGGLLRRRLRLGAADRWRRHELWALPAYGDFLERRTRACARAWPSWAPRRGSRRWSPSAHPIPDDQPDVPAHWSVTFAVDDADAIATAAAELGGTVLVPPFDAPWVRMTVIADPQGATFTASKFVPENKDMGSQSDTTVGAA